MKGKGCDPVRIAAFLFKQPAPAAGIPLSAVEAHSSLPARTQNCRLAKSTHSSPTAEKEKGCDPVRIAAFLVHGIA
jgi:hypothetical protein